MERRGEERRGEERRGEEWSGVEISRQLQFTESRRVH
jgi:hypothetical protein